jgi:hypothetical protein
MYALSTLHITTGSIPYSSDAYCPPPHLLLVHYTHTQYQGAAELAEALAKLRDESELAQRLSKRNSDLQGRLSAAAAERTEVLI